ncbi:iron complex outermembrane recepter protein [Sphingobium faniae]|nr:iron complex outermembrane recepter protein [Sphingobium faniae]
MTRSRVSAMVATSAIALAAHSVPAFAQEKPAEAEAVNPSTIVVTARRREENLLDVPVAVQALSGDALMTRGVERVDDLQTATPGLKMAPTAGRRSNSQYELRGITTIESLITEDPAVGVYVDDVYRARATGTNQSFFDISNVQVLYGPQGTLFGRNSTGGAILINSNRPTDRFEGSLEAGYGNLDQYKVTAVLNVPLSDKLQVRLAGERTKADGYVLNGSTGNMLGSKDSWAGRLSVRFAPTDTVENLLIVNGYKANDGGTPNVLYGLRSSTTPDIYGQVPALAFAPGLVALAQAAMAAERQRGYRTTYLDAAGATIPGVAAPLTGMTGYFLKGTALLGRDPYEKPRNVGISNTTTFELSDSVTLKNIFGYNYTKLETSTDLDGTPLKLVDTYYLTKNNQFSDEIQLLGETGRLNWVLGGMYFQEKGTDFQPAVQFVASYGSSLLRGLNRSIGLFGQGTYKLTDQLSLTAGARYTWDTRKVRYLDNLSAPVGASLVTDGGYGVDYSASDACNLKAAPAGQPSLINDGICGINRKAKFKEPSYTITLDYKPDPDTLLYISHRHGYRAGGFNARISPNGSYDVQFANTQAFAPEKVNDIEIGFKGNYRFGDVRVRTSIAAYNAWYSGIQKQVTQFVNGAGVTIITNAGDAEVKGFEANLGITPVSGFDIDGFVSYTDGHYKDFPNPDPNAIPALKLIQSVPFTTAKWTGGVTTALTPIDNEMGRVSWITSYSYRSSYYGGNSLPSLNEEARMPIQHNVNMMLNWDNIGSSNFSASLWARNLTNELRYLGVIDLVPTFGIAVATIGEPRTYGFTLKYKFGQ